MPRGMGRGLAAILPAPDAVDEPDLRRVPVALIRPNPDQPRRRLDPESIAALAESIAAAGVIQPLIVRMENKLLIPTPWSPPHWRPPDERHI